MKVLFDYFFAKKKNASSVATPVAPIIPDKVALDTAAPETAAPLA